MSRKLAFLLNMMLLSILLVSVVIASPAALAAGKATATPSGPTPTPSPSQPISVYGVWHCSNDYCIWGAPRNTTPGGDFDSQNHWVIDRGDGSGKPSVNLVVLAFV